MGLEFPELLLILGAVLTAAAALSGWLHGTVLSMSVLSVGAGIALALTGILVVEPTSTELFDVIELALLLTLFSDGLIVERELLQREWRKPARALVAAMPITLILIAAIAKVLLPELTWPEALLLGAVLAPTDPVVTSSIVTSTRVPAVVRHVLNLESGLNDGLALPFVLFFIAVAVEAGDVGGEVLTLVANSAIGLGVGGGLAFAGARLLPRLPSGGLTGRYEGVYALGLALTAFGLAEAVEGNGLIAAFVSGLVLGYTTRELPESFIAVNENLSSTLQVITFVLFGSLVVSTGFGLPVAALIGFAAFTLLVARPIAVAIAFLGSSLPPPHRVFVAWFGPKGVASMLFALLVLRSEASERTVVFDAASFVVLVSILAHGLTDTVGARRIQKALSPDEEDDEPGGFTPVGEPPPRTL